MLKPDGAVPTLRTFAQDMLKLVETEQRAADEKAGIAIDEAALQAQLDAIKNAPDS